MAFTPSSALLDEMPASVARTKSMLAEDLMSRFCHCSASESLEEFSESSVLVAAVAANIFWMYLCYVVLTMLPSMYESH